MYHFNNVITKSILIVLVKLARFIRKKKKKNLETQKVHASASSQNKLKEPNNEQC